ncbi:MAG: TlpA family protein disulfide reductase [Sedimentisphaerales bacterium]|nr:TlpA family protein disulfide reductase [Sedimentisphaerales bacterium]
MSKKKYLLSLAFAIIIIASAVVFLGCKKQPAEQNHSENSYDKTASEPEVTEPKTDIATAPRTGAETSAKTSLRDVIASARTWQPAYAPWFGRKAPDFTITDISGKQHKLSDYRGKNVMLIFWATWCGPCKKELPHLIALRNVVGEDNLAMLAISYISSFPPETTGKVKAFVEQNKVNYNVFSIDPGVMPSPFNSVSSIPSSFFIDPEGKIKMATAGLLSLGDMKAILQAEWP